MRPILGKDERDALLNPKEEKKEGVTFNKADKALKGQLSEKATFIVDEAKDEIIDSFEVNEGIILYDENDEVIAVIDCDYDFFKKFNEYMKAEEQRGIYNDAKQMRESIFELVEDNAEVIIKNNAEALVEKLSDAKDGFEESYKVHTVVDCSIGKDEKYLSFIGTYSVVFGDEDAQYNVDFDKDEDDMALIFSDKNEAKDHNRDEGVAIIESLETDKRLSSIVDAAMERYFKSHTKEWFIFNS